MIIDSHCHLTEEDYDNLETVISRAKENGVGVMLDVATNKQEYPLLIGLLEKYPFIYGAFGIHPDSIEIDRMITVEELLSYVHPLKIIGIGETGLDYHYETIDRKYQKEAFLTHITVAKKTNKPLIIHTRDADEDMIDILSYEMSQKSFKAVLHSFSSSEKLAKIALDLGIYFSISGMITFKKSDELRQIVKKLPLDRLLIETDSPFLAPVPYRGKQNEPAYVVETLKTLAELKSISQIELENILENNFYHLFGENIL